jgi:hypothetical protein
MIKLKAHFDGKTFVPDEPVDVPENQPLVIHIETPDTADGLSSGEWLAAHAVDDPSLPTDGARQHDHYLYGTPKKP